MTFKLPEPIVPPRLMVEPKGINGALYSEVQMHDAYKTGAQHAAAEIQLLKDKVEFFKEWKESAEFKMDLQATNIEATKKTGNEWYEAYHNKRIECEALRQAWLGSKQIIKALESHKGVVVAYAEFASNGNIRMWTSPASATPEQRKSMVPLCVSPKTHYSDCAIYNEPAYPAGECDCGVEK